MKDLIAVRVADAADGVWVGEGAFDGAIWCAEGGDKGIGR